MAGLLHRQALAAAFGELVDEGTPMEQTEAVETGRLVLAGNAPPGLLARLSAGMRDRRPWEQERG
ncbi:MAG: hypothetical protein M3072_12915 [Candidatus Dormibacteraeota bacterium]|nr:hypothetical protein [Candidatus Dormibacteraeota bacterium]